MADITNVEKAVHSYLSQRGFKAAAAEMQADMQRKRASGGGGSSLRLTDKSNAREYALGQSVPAEQETMNALLYWGTMDGDAKRYGVLYGRLQQFIAGSLESYKAELSSISYPVFVHCYLEMIVADCVDEAAALMSAWKEEHTLHYAEDVQALAMVTAPAHMEASAYVQRVRQNRFHVSLCQVTNQLLNAYLSEAALLPITHIVNTKLTVTVQDRQPAQGLCLAQLGPVDSTWGGQGVASHKLSITTAALPCAEVSRTLTAKRKRASTRVVDVSNISSADGTVEEGQDEAAWPETAPTGLLAHLRKEWYQSYLEKVVLRPLSPSDAVDVSALHRSSKLGPGEAVADPLNPTCLAVSFVHGKSMLHCAETTSDATRVAAGFNDCVRVYKIGREKMGGPPLKLAGHSRPVYAVSWAPDRRLLLSGSGDGSARLWDVRGGNDVDADSASAGKGRALAAYRGHRNAVWAVDVSPLGYYFATAGADRTALLWSTDRVSPLRLMNGHLSDITSIRFHPNASYIGTCSSDRTCRLWDVQSGSCVRVFAGAASSLSCVAVCPTGRYIAAGGDDGEAHIWDIGSGKLVSTLKGHTEALDAIAFSADGAALTTGGRDCSIKIWDVARCRAGSTSPSPKHTFYTKNTPLVALRYTPRNLLLAVGVFNIDAKGE